MHISVKIGKNMNFLLLVYYIGHGNIFFLKERKNIFSYRAHKSRTTLQNKVRLKVLPEQLTLFVNTSVTFKNCIIQ